MKYTLFKFAGFLPFLLLVDILPFVVYADISPIVLTVIYSSAIITGITFWRTMTLIKQREANAIVMLDELKTALDGLIKQREHYKCHQNQSIQ